MENLKKIPAAFLLVVMAIGVGAYYLGIQAQEGEKQRMEQEQLGYIQKSNGLITDYKNMLLNQANQFQHQELLSATLIEKIAAMVKDPTKPQLFYRYPNNACGSCIMADIGVMKQFQKEDGMTPLILVSYNENDRNERIRVTNELQGLPHISIPDQAVNINQEISEIGRFFAKLHPDGTISNIFLPGRDYPDLTRTYIETHFID